MASKVDLQDVSGVADHFLFPNSFSYLYLVSSSMLFSYAQDVRSLPGLHRIISSAVVPILSHSSAIILSGFPSL